MKKILFAISVLVLLGVSAYASETRLETMGMGNFYYNGTYVKSINTIIKDYANIEMYPSTINYYPNLFWGQIDACYDDDSKSIDGYNDYFYKAGALFQLGEKNPWVLGAHFSTMPYENPFDHDLDNYDSNQQTNHRLNLYYGRNLSNIPFGFTLGYYRSSQINEDVQDSTFYNQYEDTYNRYEFGFGISPMSGKLDLALSLAMTSWTDKFYHYFGDGAGNVDSGLVDDTEPDGNFEFALRARYFMDPVGKFTCVPHFTFDSRKYGEKYFTNTAINEETYSTWQVYRTDETKVSVFDLGIGTNYDASENVLVAADFGVAFGSYKYSYNYADTNSYDASDEAEYKYNYKAMPYFRLGIDAEVFKWMDFRAGVVSMWNQYKYERSFSENGGGDNYSYSSGETFTTTQTFLGVGLHWNALEIDALLDPEFLLNGPYFIGGEETNDNYDSGSMFGKITLTYGF